MNKYTNKYKHNFNSLTPPLHFCPFWVFWDKTPDFTIALLSLLGVLGQNSGRHECTFVPFGCFGTKSLTPPLHFCPFWVFWDKIPDATTALLSLLGVLGQNSGRHHCTFVPFGCFGTKLLTSALVNKK